MEQEKTKIGKFGVATCILVVILIGYFSIFSNKKYESNDELAPAPSFQDIGFSQPLNENIINCEFKVTTDFVFKNKKDSLSEENRKIYYETSVASDGKQSLITFAGLSTRLPQIKGNLGDSPVTLLKNDSETIVIAEENMMGDIFLYTIFKKEKVATWYKSYKLGVTSVPFGMLSMGYCY